MKPGLRPPTAESYELLQRGAIAMSRIERTGIRVDTAYLNKTIKSIKQELIDKERSLSGTKEWKLWSRQYGDRMSLEAPAQLGHVVFKLLGCKRNPHLVLKQDERERGRGTDEKNDEAAYEHLDVPFVKLLLEWKKLKKAYTTVLLNLKKEEIDGFIHPLIDLFSTESGRSACRTPNLQNTHVRNKQLSKIVRSCFIPREGNTFLEVDYSTQEVRFSYLYNKDPKLLYDILHGDMHKDRAKELYMLTEEELGPIGVGSFGKDVRYCAKNMYVFPGFYGSYYCQCAPNLWDAIRRLKLCRADGVGLYDHLREKGIKRLGACDPDSEAVKGTFEYHVKKIEQHQWNEVYTVYDDWKRRWWDLYQRQGGVNTLTGWCLAGDFRRNQILCDPIQGDAFKCLLWCIIEIQEELIRRKMKSKIVLQIHDSFLFDTVPSELQDLIQLVYDYAVKKVAQHWKWITCPLSLEYEIAEPNWYEKRPLEVKL